MLKMKVIIGNLLLKYYFEDYLKDYGFVEKEKERITTIKEVDKRIAV